MISDVPTQQLSLNWRSPKNDHGSGSRMATNTPKEEQLVLWMVRSFIMVVYDILPPQWSFYTCLWFCSRGGLCPGGLCPGDLCPGGLYTGGSLFGGSLSGRFSVQGSMSRGVSVQGVSVRKTPFAVWLCGGGAHRTVMHSRWEIPSQRTPGGRPPQKEGPGS